MATYTVQRGDDLGKIAAKTLGTSARWREIWDLNKAKIPNPDVIQIGQVLTLPGGALSIPIATTDAGRPSYMPTKAEVSAPAAQNFFVKVKDYARKLTRNKKLMIAGGALIGLGVFLLVRKRMK